MAATVLHPCTCHGLQCLRPIAAIVASWYRQPVKLLLLCCRCTCICTAPLSGLLQRPCLAFHPAAMSGNHGASLTTTTNPSAVRPCLLPCRRLTHRAPQQPHPPTLMHMQTATHLLISRSRVLSVSSIGSRHQGSSSCDATSSRPCTGAAEAAAIHTPHSLPHAAHLCPPSPCQRGQSCE